MTPYPATLPKDDMQLVLTAIRNKTLRLDSHEVAKDAWETVGFGLRQTLGELPNAPAPSEPLPYPTEIPTDEILLVIANLRGIGGTPTPEIAKAVWETVGFGLFKTVGEWNPDPSPVPAPAPTPGEIIANHLELALNHPSGLVAGAIPIPWALIIKWGLTLLAELIP